jgi:amidase
MSDREIEIFPDPPVYNLGLRQRPLATVKPGDLVKFHTSDAGYREAIDHGLESDPQLLHRLNALTGPIAVEEAEPGDALEVTIERIKLGDRAYVVYVDRWGRRTFGMEGSWIRGYGIVDNEIVLDERTRIPIRPMIGCAGVAPATNSLSSLSPTKPEGGNMDLRQLEPGSRLMLPIAVEGALFALGDLHAAMGQGEPAGAGFECSGTVSARFAVRKNFHLKSPRIESRSEILFLGIDPGDLWIARQRAIASAWRFLLDECRVDRERAFALVSGLLKLEFGGPAGGNVLAVFNLAELDRAGVEFQSA